MAYSARTPDCDPCATTYRRNGRIGGFYDPCSGHGRLRLAVDIPLEPFCQCCGHPDGTCARCGARHHPALPEGCEACSSSADESLDRKDPTR